MSKQALAASLRNRRIKALIKSGATQAEIAEMLGLSRQRVHQIKSKGAKLMNPIDIYLDNSPGLSPVTKKARRGLLNKYGTWIYRAPNETFSYLKDTAGLSTGSIKTIMMSMCAYLDFMIERGDRQENRIKPWLKKNKKLFPRNWRGLRERLDVLPDIHTVMLLIEGIDDEETREKAMQLVSTGMRWSESFSIEVIGKEKGRIIGKGSKERFVYGPWARPIPYSKDKTTFHRQLKKATGLSAHDLRRIKASHVAELTNGNAFVLREAFGWSNVATAIHYVKTDEEKVREAMTKEIKDVS